MAPGGGGFIHRQEVASNHDYGSHTSQGRPTRNSNVWNYLLCNHNYPMQVCKLCLDTVKHEIFADLHHFATCNFRGMDNLLYGLLNCS